MSDFHKENEKLDALVRSELTALEQGVARLRELLQIHGEGHGPTPAPITWNTTDGPKGTYEWITIRQDPEMATRLTQGPMISEGFLYWMNEDLGVIMRRKQEAAEQ